MERKKSVKKLWINWWVSMVCFVGCFIVMICSVDRTEEEQNKNNEEIKVPEIKEVVVPINITDSNAKFEYIVENFWKEVDFSDTTYIVENTTFEKAFVDYISVVENAYSDSLTCASVGLLLNKAQNGGEEMYFYVLRLYEKYLYNADSPMRNDGAYVEVLNYAIDSNMADSLEKIRPKCQLQQMLISAVGKNAEEFSFVTNEGVKKNLSDVNNDYIMMFFYNDSCEVCKEIRRYMSDASVFYNKRLTVVEVNTESNDSLKEKFDIRATPCLYLLNDEKIILLKDASIEQIEQYLLDREI